MSKVCRKSEEIVNKVLCFISTKLNEPKIVIYRVFVEITPGLCYTIYVVSVRAMSRYAFVKSRFYWTVVVLCFIFENDLTNDRLRPII